jgi:hypothetical protein
MTENKSFRNSEWNMFRNNHSKFEPIQICRQVIRHKRFLHSELGHRQRLLHDNRTLHELNNSAVHLPANNRTKLRSHLLNSDYWHMKKTVEAKQQ